MFGFGRRRAIRLASDRLARARREGAGVYLEEWRIGAGGDLTVRAGSSESLAQPVLAWCRETLASTRRPWGIVNFDLALAVSGGVDVRTLSMRALAPSDLYPGDSLLAEINRFLESERDAIGHLAVALFSWGDAAHVALPPA